MRSMKSIFAMRMITVVSLKRTNNKLYICLVATCRSYLHLLALCSLANYIGNNQVKIHYQFNYFKMQLVGVNVRINGFLGSFSPSNLRVDINHLQLPKTLKSSNFNFAKFRCSKYSNIDRNKQKF